MMDDSQGALRGSSLNLSVGVVAGNEQEERESGPRREYRYSQSPGHVGMCQSQLLEKDVLVEGQNEDDPRW